MAYVSANQLNKLLQTFLTLSYNTESNISLMGPYQSIQADPTLCSFYLIPLFSTLKRIPHISVHINWKDHLILLKHTSSWVSHFTSPLSFKSGWKLGLFLENRSRSKDRLDPEENQCCLTKQLPHELIVPHNC